MPETTNPGKAELRERIAALCATCPDEVLHTLLQTQFWPTKIAAGQKYECGEDHPELGGLSIAFSPNGSGFIFTVQRKNRPPLQFHTTENGGQHPMVRQALMFLAVAITIEQEQSATAAAK
jgi:hypothetical protein